MLLREFEGKRLLRAAGVAVPSGLVVRSPAALARRRLAFPVAVKAQVASGGRGRAGGVVKAESRNAAEKAVAGLLGRTFDGELCDAVLVEPWLPITRETYLSVTIDGRAGGYVLLYSPQGGIDIEEGAPPARYEVGPAGDFRAHRLRAILVAIERDERLREQVISLSRLLVSLAAAQDCMTVEVNPLVLVEGGGLVVADAKVVMDEAAAFRSAEIAAAQDRAQRKEPNAVRRALQGRLMLVWLDGDIGLLSAGAGMTMAAMDAIQDFGGRPACFLDCSANPTPKGYRLAFDLLDTADKVRVILVNIFGGGVHMDRVARAMAEIMAKHPPKKPVVFRMNGTNADQIPAVFQPNGLFNHGALEEAVQAAISIAKGQR
jgi:succinyl-CoA synthetase beta subunit